MRAPEWAAARSLMVAHVAWPWPLALAIAMIMGSGGLAVLQHLHFVMATEQVRRSYDVLDSVGSVVSRLVAAESGQRGYLLTGRGEFLSPYLEIDADSRRSLIRLRGLVADDTRSLGMVERLGALADAKRSEMALILAIQAGGSSAQATARLTEGTGASLMDDIREVGNSVGRRERDLIVGRTRQAEQARRASLGFALLSLASSLGFGGAAVSVRRRLGQRLEDERARVTAIERSVRADAERTEHLKNDFVDMLSHELRTPLNAIQGWLGVLRRDQSPETLAKGLDVITRNSVRQSRMIDDLLDVSRIVSGTLRLDVTRVDVVAAIEEAMTSVRPSAHAKDVDLVSAIDASAFIDGDPQRVRQIVWNLLSNAVTFTPRGGRVRVTLSAAGNQTTIAVTDTGQGITADVLPHIFERFQQSDSTLTRQHGGLGLGLAIVKSLTEMHGGRVDATSPGPGAGSTFTIRLPLRAVGPRSHRATESPRLALRAPVDLLTGVTALVLDDEPDSRELVARLLASVGATVSSVGSAREAVARLEQGLVPDVIVSDIGMPDEDGYQFMRRVRGRRDRASKTPAAALTALTTREDCRRALMAGYQRHLAKPVDPDELIATVASLTGRTGRQLI